MGVRFKKRFAVKIPPEVISRIRHEFTDQKVSENMTEHWKSRDQVKQDAFDFSSSDKVYYKQDENGLDDYYPANFGYGQSLTILSTIKKIYLEDFRAQTHWLWTL